MIRLAMAALLALAASAQAQDPARAFAGHAETETVTLDHAGYAELLAAHVAQTPAGAATFDYAAVTPDERAALGEYIARMEAIDPGALTRDQKIAYWSNLYNAVTLRVVLDAMPVESIRDIELEKPEPKGFFAALGDAVSGPGPWDAPVAEVNGVTLTLDDMEHEILRKMDEPRIHYAVNCASYSCPDLRAEPWRAEGLDAALDAAAADYVNDPRGLRAGPRGPVVSSIYKWFDEDFGGTEAGVIAHLREHAGPEAMALLDGATEIGRYDYDWTLNSPEAVAAIEAGG